MNLRSLLFQNKFIFFIQKNRLLTQLVLFLFCVTVSAQQTANYVNNGSFEDRYNCNWPYGVDKAKYWRSADSLSYGGAYFSVCNSVVPYDGIRYQWARTGSSYIVSTNYCPPPNCSSTSNRGYQRNRLKSTLIAGKTYCVKFYVNISNASSFGIDGFGAYFGDYTLDTITYGAVPLTYLTPQIQNPTNNLISDTLNWILITGTFVATGIEKYMLIGNFKSDASTNTVIANASSLPQTFTDIALDDVSCIPIDLPAYAGADIWGIPGNTVYIGRQQDVGIDEACMWYKLPNVTTTIDTAAGMTLTVGLVTNTYVVKQDICGIIKWDTVIVHASAVGLSETEFIKNNISVFPNPANDVLNMRFNLPDANLFSRLRIINNLGQIIREEDLDLKNTSIDITNIPVGVYILDLISNKQVNVSKRFVITR